MKTTKPTGHYQEKTLKNFRILLDLDDVLVDFIGAACHIHGLEYEETQQERRETGLWSMQEAWGFIENDFWKPINKRGTKFWRDLELLPWFTELLETVDHFSKSDWRIVTSPMPYQRCRFGKILWMSDQFGQEFNKFHLTPHKCDFAQENVILIDDRLETIEKFREAGGRGILFPEGGNINHVHSTNPIPYVTEMLESIICD